MSQHPVIDEQELHYLRLLAKSYPTIQAACTEIINLQAIMGLPKGTEHFMSDLHGEHEAFDHILNNASGMVRDKVDLLYSMLLPEEERQRLASLIYYPRQKIEEAKRTVHDLEEWYKITLRQLIRICREVSGKYTRSKVRKALPKDFAYILEELLSNNQTSQNQEAYFDKTIESIIEVDCADAFVEALCALIKRLIVDHLHIVGDLFDRGPRPDIILDRLMAHHSVDIQWGNHDILWMGAAAGSWACIAVVLNNCMQYSNLDVLEEAYGINLRPLALFAEDVYRTSDCTCFAPKQVEDTSYEPEDIQRIARMHKAITLIQFKLEGQIILRHPEYGMESRMLLDKIDYRNHEVLIGNKCYPIRDCDFPTVDPADPYALTSAEETLMQQLEASFLRSERLQRHVGFLFSVGSIYRCYNGNLLYHGCIPMNEDGTFLQFDCGAAGRLSGRKYMDYAEAVARQGYHGGKRSPLKQFGQDFMWFLWCGKNSPLCGRHKIATFERFLVDDPETHEEPKNAYYQLIEDPATCMRILNEFGLTGEYCHIVNGHMPVRASKGESPVKAGSKLIVIDGGFCKAYHRTTGIAGYTMFYNSYGMRIAAHEAFSSTADAIANNSDIHSTSVVFDRAQRRIKVAETDAGKEIARQIDELKLLLRAYRTGRLKEAKK